MQSKLKSYFRQKHITLLQNLLFFLILIASACLLFWKCRFGFGNIDEAFYLTIPYRLLQGDALLLEEWHLSQMAGVLTLPFVASYTAIQGNTDGMILAMRYFCTFIQCLIAIFLYIRLKGISWVGAVTASVSFVLFIPFGIMALSYNSMGIMALLVCLVIALTAQRHRPLQYSLSGLFFAAAVLCCPYLLLVYLLYLAAVALSSLYRRKNAIAETDSFFHIRGAVWFSLGAVLAAIAFTAFVLSRASLSQILQSLPFLLNDPEHPKFTLASKTESFFLNIFYINAWAPYLYTMIVLIACIIWLDKKRAQRKIVYALLLTLCTLTLHYSLYHFQGHINFTMWSVNVLALFLFFLTDQPQIRSLFCYIWLPGILYAFCLNLSSNNLFWAISSASSVSTVASLMIIALFLRELMQPPVPPTFCRRACVFSMSLLLIVQLLSQGYQRYQTVFWDSGGIDSQTEYIAEGVEAGIYSSEGARNTYDSKRKSLQVLNQYQGQPVLYLSTNTWYYLIGDHPMATYSAWTSGIDTHTLNQLEAYYAINQEKFPHVVFADVEYRDVAEEFCRRFGFDLEETPGGYLLTPQ